MCIYSLLLSAGSYAALTIYPFRGPYYLPLIASQRQTPRARITIDCIKFKKANGIMTTIVELIFLHHVFEIHSNVTSVIVTASVTGNFAKKFAGLLKRN